jgi:hypothetical protein
VDHLENTLSRWNAKLEVASGVEKDLVYEEWDEEPSEESGRS